MVMHSFYIVVSKRLCTTDMRNTRLIHRRKSYTILQGVRSSHLFTLNELHKYYVL